VIITRASDIEALPKSPYVTFRSGLSKRECLEMMARARLSVTPVGNQSTASGQITFIASMQIGMPVIATACPGTDGYITDGVTGVLVPPSDVAALQAAISELWQDPERRATLADAARTEAAQRFSDAAAGRALQEILMEVDPAVQPAREVAPQA
jgi:glycosyltransferase involved in cell wall biosynthesis